MDLKLIYFIVNFIFTFSAIRGDGESYDAPQTLELYHSIDDTTTGLWNSCGIILLENLNGGPADTPQIKLSTNETSRLIQLAQQNGIYRVKAIIKTTKGKEIILHTFSKACSLFEEESQVSITIHFDQSGSVVGVNLSPKYVCQTKLENSPREIAIDVNFHHKLAEMGPIPDTATYIQKIEKEREAKEKGAGPDHRSFLAKYWMYIVPVMLFVVLSGAANGEGTAGS